MKTLMKTAAVAALAMTTAILPAAVVSETPVEIKNADFAAIENGRLTGWSQGNKLTVVNGKEGDKSFMTVTAAEAVSWAAVGQTVLSVKDLPALKEGERYEFVLTFRQKTADIDKIALANISVMPEKGGRLKYADSSGLKGTIDWTNRNATLKLAALPEGAVSIRLNFFLNGTGSASFGDVKFTVKVVK